MSPFTAELLGTLLLITLGNGVVANALLNKSKGQNAGWIVITAGWAFAVTVGVYVSKPFSGGHLNPAFTLALAFTGAFPWSSVASYVVAQLLGALLGSLLVWLAYLPHWKETPDVSAKLAVFCTAPAIRQPVANLITEIIGTFVLVFGAMAMTSPKNMLPNSGFDSGFAPCLVGLLVWGIGVSLGGPTGYAINPIRDFGPRLAHALLPIAGKGGSDWAYAWVPIVGPLLGGTAGAFCHQLVNR